MKRFWIFVLSILVLSLFFAAAVNAADTPANDFKISMPDYVYYSAGGNDYYPTVTAGGKLLRQLVDYTLSYENISSVGIGSVTATGKGQWSGMTSTTTFRIVRKDISTMTANIKSAPFSGMAVQPNVFDSSFMRKGKDYVVVYENNYNTGTGYARVIGIGNYCGSKTFPFTIEQQPFSIQLNGTYIGNANGGVLDPEKAYYSQLNIFPSTFKVQLRPKDSYSARNHYAYYELYKVVSEEEAVLITTYESPYGSGDTTAFTYDFSSVYEDAADIGGEIYLLSYTWVDDRLDVYAGVCALAVPAKMDDATSMTIEKIPNINDPMREYFAASVTDGHLGVVSWSVSDPSIATIENGVLTKLAPGTVTVTATCGDLSASMDVTIESFDLRKVEIYSYNPKTTQVVIVYDDYLLRSGKEYSHSVAAKDGIRDVIVTGKNSFYGYIMRQFDSVTGEPIGHTHSLQEICSETCMTCDFTRTCNHTKSTTYARDQSGHWYLCSVCGGGKTDFAAHVLSADDPELCTVCGSLNIPGDLNADVNLNDADAMYLLRHTLFPSRYPVEKDPDINKDGEVNDTDAMYLLRHTLFPTRYPLYPA